MQNCVALPALTSDICHDRAERGTKEHENDDFYHRQRNNITTFATVGGANASEFGLTNHCGATLAAAESCTFTVKFTPAATGTRTADVGIADNAAGSPQTAGLTGTGK